MNNSFTTFVQEAVTTPDQWRNFYTKYGDLGFKRQQEILVNDYGFVYNSAKGRTIKYSDKEKFLMFVLEFS
jgi:hypothetical protein